MSEVIRCAECRTPLPVRWPKGLCARCAIDGALEMANNPSEVVSQQTLVVPAPPVVQEDFPLGSFGDYELLEEIARGGMGVVYKARQVSLGRIVAIKMILAGSLAGKEFVQRFRTEVSTAAILQHPNIVAIYEVGVREGRHYFSMEYVAGQDLAQFVGQKPLPAPKAARYVQIIAQAIHYAHENGVLHRDLKPSNILLDSNDQPRITDFGLAKRLDGNSSLTVSGQVLGSPSFMPPEQAGGERGKLGRASDVYALGGILYYLLTARSPFQADSLESLLTQVIHNEPISPRSLNPSIPKDLETITVKCLQKEPARRYQTAQELADELDRFLREEPIRARPVSTFEKGWRWCRRKPALAGAIGLAITALIAGFAATSWQWLRAERSAKSELQQREQAEAQGYNSDMNLAQQALSQNNLGRALAVLNRHQPKSGEKDRRGWEWRYLWKSCQSDAAFTLSQQSNYIDSVTFSSDGRFLALADESSDLEVWKLSSRTRLASRKTGIHKQRIAFSPVSNDLAFCEKAPDGQCSLVWWNIQEFAERRVPLPGEAREVVFSGDGNIIAAWCWQKADAPILLFESNSGRQLSAIPAGRHKDDPVNLLSLSHEGETLAYGTAGGEVVVVDTASGDVKRIAATTESVMAVALSRDGRTLASAAGYSEPYIKLWDLNTGEQTARLEGHRSYVSSLGFSQDGRRLVSASGDQTIRLWDWKEKKTEATLRGHLSEVFTVAFSPDGQTLASGCKDGSVCLWKAESKPSESTYETLPIPVVDWKFTSDSKQIIGRDEGGILHSWATENLRETHRFVELGTGITSFALSKNGLLLVAGNETGQVQVLSLSAELPKRAFTACFGPARVIGFSANEDFLLTHDTNNVVSRWETGSWHLIHQWRVDGSLYRHRLEPALGLLATGGRGQLILWNGMDGHRLWVASGQDELEGIDFSGDGKLVATASGKGPVKLFDTGTGRELATLTGFLQGTHSVAFSPDNKRLAVGSGGKEALKLWDPQMHQEVLTLEGQKSFFFKTVFSPDGGILSSANYRGIVHLWRAPSWEEIASSE